MMPGVRSAKHCSRMMRRLDLKRLPREILSVPQDVTGSLAHEAQRKSAEVSSSRTMAAAGPHFEAGTHCRIHNRWLPCRNERCFPRGLLGRLGLHARLSLSSGTSGTCLVHRRSDWPCGSCNCPAGLLATHPVRWAHKLDSFARDPLLGRHCSGGNASPEFHLSGRTSRPKFSAVHRGEWPFQRSLELDLAEGADCNPGLDDRNRFAAAQACLPSRSSRRYRLAVRIRLAPSRHRSSWGTSLVELRPAG
jgi:hypothetical protein